jgi:hypothetical protein
MNLPNLSQTFAKWKRALPILDALATCVVALGFLISACAGTTHWMLFFGLILIATVIKTASEDAVKEMRATRAGITSVYRGKPVSQSRDARNVR